MKIFLTGSTGFIGSRLLPRLVKDGHEVICLLRSPEKYKDDAVYQQCRIVKGNVIDKQALAGSMDGADVVIHLAVLGHVESVERTYEDFCAVNVKGTRNVLEECLRAKPKRIICFSSTAAIGVPRCKVINEDTPCEPILPYGQSKKDADDLVTSFMHEHHLPLITLCFPHVYGPGDTRDFLKISRLIKKGVFPQVGFSPNLYPAIYLDDAIEAILLAVSGKGETGRYIIADDDPHDLRDIRKYVLKALGIRRAWYPVIPAYFSIAGLACIETICHFFGVSLPIKVKNLHSITAGRKLSIAKAQRDMGFAPKVLLEDGVAQTIAWYQKEDLI